MAKGLIQEVVEANPPLSPGGSDLDYLGNIPTQYHRRHHPVDLLIEDPDTPGEWATVDGLVWERVTLGCNGRDTLATIAARTLDGARLSDAHLVDFANILNGTRRVRIAQSFTNSPPVILFQGWPQPVTLSWGPRHQQLAATCISEGQELLRTAEWAQVHGRWMRSDPANPYDPQIDDVITVTALPAVFNAAGRGNRSHEDIEFSWPEGIPEPEPALEPAAKRCSVFTFDGASNGRRWTFVQALRSICWQHIVRSGHLVSVVEFLRDTADLQESPPVSESADPFVRQMTQYVDDVSVSGLHVEGAIAVLCKAAGLGYEIATRTSVDGTGAEHFLRVWAPIAETLEEQATPERAMGSPRVRDLPRQGPFSASPTDDPITTASLGRVASATLTIDRRTTTLVRAFGGHRLYEVTLLLRPGWLPHDQLDALSTDEERAAAIEFWRGEFEPEKDADTGLPRSVYHTGHPDHAAHADVFRTWVFPDTADYYLAGYGRVAYPERLYNPLDPDGVDGATVWRRSDIGGGLSIGVSETWSLRPRALLPPIGRKDVKSPERKPIIRFNFSAASAEAALADANWVEFGGQAEIDPLRAVVRLREADLWHALPLFVDPDAPDIDDSRAIVQFIHGSMWVSVTCTVRGDERLDYVRGFPAPRARVVAVDTGLTRFQYRSRRHQNSHLNALPADQADYEDRDDTTELSQHAYRIARAGYRPTVAGDPQVFWIAPEYRPGDAFSGVDGLGIPFDLFPAIEAIEYSLGEDGYRTTLHLTDMRHAPDVGEEA